MTGWVVEAPQAGELLLIPWQSDRWPGRAVLGLSRDKTDMVIAGTVLNADFPECSRRYWAPNTGVADPFPDFRRRWVAGYDRDYPRSARW